MLEKAGLTPPPHLTAFSSHHSAGDPAVPTEESTGGVPQRLSIRGPELDLPSQRLVAQALRARALRLQAGDLLPWALSRYRAQRQLL